MVFQRNSDQKNSAEMLPKFKRHWYEIMEPSQSQEKGHRHHEKLRGRVQIMC